MIKLGFFHHDNKFNFHFIQKCVHSFQECRGLWANAFHYAHENHRSTTATYSSRIDNGNVSGTQCDKNLVWILNRFVNSDIRSYPIIVSHGFCHRLSLTFFTVEYSFLLLLHKCKRNNNMYETGHLIACVSPDDSR